MIRTKVINDSTDLVSILRAFDTPIKKEVFIEISKDWMPTSMILDKFGEEGQKALEFFDIHESLSPDAACTALRVVSLPRYMAWSARWISSSGVVASPG